VTTLTLGLYSQALSVKDADEQLDE